MMTRRRLSAMALIAIMLAACGRAGAPQGGAIRGEIHFAVQSTESAAVVSGAWRPILADMERRTGLKVKLHVYAKDAALIEAMHMTGVDAGLFSNLAGLGVVRHAGGEVFARTADPEGVAARVSVLIAASKRGLTLDRALKCRRTLTLGMGDTLSTAGALAPMTYLFAPRDIDPRTCFKEVRVGVTPETDLTAVAKGQLDLAAVSSTALALDQRQGRPGAAAVTVLWSSPPLPQDPIVRRRSLDPVVKEKLRQFFLTYGQGDGAGAVKARGYLAKINIGGFKPADDSHLLPVREMEATSAWYGAKRAGDKAKIAAAQGRRDEITAERVSLEARTRAPAAAQ